MADESLSELAERAATLDELPAVNAMIAKVERALRETVVDDAPRGCPPRW